MVFLVWRSRHSAFWRHPGEPTPARLSGQVIFAGLFAGCGVWFSGSGFCGRPSQSPLLLPGGHCRRRANTHAALQAGCFCGAVVGCGAWLSGSGFCGRPSQPPLFFRAALSAVTTRRGGFGGLFCSWLVHVSRCKVALGSGVGRCFAGAPIPFPNPAFERDWPISVLSRPAVF